MKSIKIKTPAKINLTLEVLGLREDGFHEIQSIMQAVSLFDILTIDVKKTQNNQIYITGNSDEIPYDQSNLAYIAADKFLKELKKTFCVEIYIDKRIPVKAGMAGGSTNAAGVLYGLNKIFDNPFTSEELLNLASEIGSDVSFCLFGGTQMATSKGEVLKKVGTPSLRILGIKPKRIGISAKEAYELYDEMNITSNRNATFNMLMAVNKGADITNLIHNDLEFAIERSYPQIQQLKDYMLSIGCKNSLMSGSGSTVFGIVDEQIEIPKDLDADCFLAETISYGVRVV